MDLDTFLENTPRELLDIQQLYEYQQHLEAFSKRSRNPFFTFLYLINFVDEASGYLPYEYTPPENLPFAELALLANAILAYTTAPEATRTWLDKLLELDQEAQEWDF
jgi:hypothetical protein